MEKTEFIFGRFFELTVESAHRLEHAEGPDDIGLDKVFRTMNAAVDVRFGGEIDDGPRLVLG
jgi:hypothetical protein